MFTGKAAIWVGGTAAAAGLAKFGLESEFTLKALIQHIIGAYVGAAVVISSTILWPQLLDDVPALCSLVFLSAFLVMPILKIVFWRIEHVDLTVNVGGVGKLNSDGKTEE